MAEEITEAMSNVSMDEPTEFKGLFHNMHDDIKIKIMRELIMKERQLHMAPYNVIPEVLQNRIAYRDAVRRRLERVRSTDVYMDLMYAEERVREAQDKMKQDKIEKYREIKPKLIKRVETIGKMIDRGTK